MGCQWPSAKTCQSCRYCGFGDKEKKMEVLSVLQIHQKRVVEERHELGGKIEKLLAFLDTDAFKLLDYAEQLRLQRQVVAMDQYYSILDERVDAFMGVSKAEPVQEQAKVPVAAAAPLDPWNMQPVKADSSHIVAVGHNGHDMRVEYKGSRFYTFLGIPAAKAQEIRLSDSPGAAINALGIKGTLHQEPKAAKG